MIVYIGEFKGQRMFGIWKDQETLDKHIAGEKVYPELSFGMKKVNLILSHLPAILAYNKEYGGECPSNVIDAIEDLET